MAVTYLDSSAIVKLVVRERESAALRRHLRHRHLISSVLARTEVLRALLPLGADAAAAGRAALGAIDLVRVNERVLADAAGLLPVELRTLDAIHLATAQQLGPELGRLVTYDERMATAAKHLGLRTVAPV